MQLHHCSPLSPLDSIGVKGVKTLSVSLPIDISSDIRLKHISNIKTWIDELSQLDMLYNFCNVANSNYYCASLLQVVLVGKSIICFKQIQNYI